jgi:phage-related tail fiber protein
MSNTIRIKRRLAGGAAGAPSTLENAELAFNEQDSTLYYGVGTGGAGGSASSILSIAGPGAYMTLGTTQTVSGNKTFSGDVIVPTQLTSDNSTKAASTAYVKGQGYITGNQSITVSGDASGSGTTSISLTLASVGTAGTYTKVTTDAKGRVTSGTTLGASDIPTLTASKISDFDTQVRTSRLDQMAAPTASVSLNSQKITNLLDPTNPQDAATKAYVDAARSGLDVKASVRAASTANVAGATYNATGGTSARGQITTAPNTLDGVTLALNDRILLKDQSTGAQNGIWIVSTVGTGATGVWDRATDFDADAEVTAGAFTFVTEGTANGDSGWVLTTNDTITIGGASGTALTFAQFSGAGQITAGAGLTKTGNTIDVATASTGRIVVNADSIDLASGIATPGTYQSLTVDTYGRVTGGTNPTTLSGFGITDAQPLDATLTALAGVATVADRLIYATGVDTFTVTTFTAFGRSLVDDVDAAGARTTLGLGTIATQNANAVAITGGTIDGITLDGGTFAFIAGVVSLVLHSILSSGSVSC